MKYLLFMLALAGMVNVSLAQTKGVLRGSVRNAEGRPVIGALVIVQGTKLGAVVRPPNGEFIITGILSGTYSVVVKAVGYHENIDAVDVIAGDTVLLNVEIVQKIEGDTIKLPHRKNPKVGTIRQISVEEIKDMERRDERENGKKTGQGENDNGETDGVIKVKSGQVGSECYGVLTGRVIDNNGKHVIGAAVSLQGTNRGTYSKAPDGRFLLDTIPCGSYVVQIMAVGMELLTKTVTITTDTLTLEDLQMSGGILHGGTITIRGDEPGKSQIVVDGVDIGDQFLGSFTVTAVSTEYMGLGFLGKGDEDLADPYMVKKAIKSEDKFQKIEENIFRQSLHGPLSTFSIDVDRASYSIARRYIRSGSMPPVDAVRLEEFVNYFSYDYPGPVDEHPFAVHGEITECPWNAEHRLMRIGIQGKRIAAERMPAANLVFLIDVSGSMSDPDKLPLLKKAFSIFVEQLRPEDRVAIVVYAGAAGLVLPSTPGSERGTILASLERLNADGGTNGEGGIRLAYDVAGEHFSEEGINRVILATDGDFNVGLSDIDDLVELIEKQRETGIYLTTLGFGGGNYNDALMEKLADRGNGNYAYIDDISEGRRALVDQLGGTLLTIASDVKLQIEFNPEVVEEYRLLGYENRMLKTEDFDDDTRDAGELGSGHSVTALYEIIPAERSDRGEHLTPWLDDGTGKRADDEFGAARFTREQAAEVKVRYKRPGEDRSNLMRGPVVYSTSALPEASAETRFAAAVAEFALLLRDSAHKGGASYEQVVSLAESGLGSDPDGYRRGFVDLVKQCRRLSGK